MIVESTFQPWSLSILYLKATNVLLCFKCNQQLTVTLRYILTSLDYSGNEGVWQKDAALPSFTYNHKTKQSCYTSARHLFLQQHSLTKDALTLCSLRLYFLSTKQTCGLAGILEKELSSWDSHSFVSSPWIFSQAFSTEQVTWTTFSLWVADKFAHAILSAHRDKILFVSWFHNTEFWYANVPSLQYPTINTR